VNGDGLADVLVGTDYIQSKPSAEYVVYGRTGTDAIELSAVAAGIGGFSIRTEFQKEAHLSDAGDVNGDGLSDLIVASPRQGRTYVVFGATTGAFSGSEVDRLGGAGDDTLAGNGKSNVLVGGEGDDTLVGNGGADVLYGGAGDDVFLLERGNVEALLGAFGTNGNTQHLARLDGGAGIDTLRLVGAGIALDLAKAANQGAGGAGSTSRIESIERIDLTGSGDNALTMGARDVQDLAGMNLIDSASQAALGWTNGTYAFPPRVGRHQLVVDGDAGDVVHLKNAANGWTNAGTVFSHGVEYVVYNSKVRPRTGFERVQVIVAGSVVVGE
jgi:hypothetical protein